jgi:hypothetical protein
MESQTPVKPTVTIDAVSESAAEFSTSAFSGGSGVHQDTQWQVARDAAFTDLVESTVSAVDLEEHSTTGLESGVQHWARARFRDDAGVIGEWADGVDFTTGANPGTGDPPELTVQDVEATEITVGVEADPAYLNVTYRLQQGTTTLATITKTGSTRFQHTWQLLTAATTYAVSANVLRTEGLSPWSAPIAVTTLAEDIDPANLLGCPPPLTSWAWNPDANPVDWQTRRGYGWYVPYAGQPLRGLVTCILRYPADGGSWDIDISDDLGVTYTPVAIGVEQSGEDGDGIQTYQFALDTTLFADGQDYRLRATAGSTVLESLSFCIDNAVAITAWANRDFNLEDDRYATLWHRKKGVGVWGGEATGEKVWWQGAIERSVIALRGHGISAFVDQQVPLCLGGDVTIRFYIWSGEGGLFHQQARMDAEGWLAGIGFFVEGSSDETQDHPSEPFKPPAGSSGLFVGLECLQITALGCCDEFLVSHQGTNLQARGRPTAADLWTSLQSEDDEFVSTAIMKLAERFHAKHAYILFKYLTGAVKALFIGRFMKWRDGHLPGVSPSSAQTCGRRYEMCVVRARVEVDAGDHSRIRIRARVDHAGIEPPAAGYWHYDRWHLSPNDWTEGVLAVVSAQHARTLYGDANGARTFVSYSMLPLNPTTLPELPPEDIEPVTIPQEGAPCTLILEAYEDDRVTLKWEVGTDRNHVRPYLMEPEHYGEQEIDVVAGAASIAQVEVAVIDRAQTPGDQASGWMTERLTDGGQGIIHGRRFRLIRFISPELGWVVIADGPGGTPRLDSSYAAYRWSIRDTRETERKLRAFQDPSPFSLYPSALVEQPGWGLKPDGTFIVPALEAMPTATVVYAESNDEVQMILLGTSAIDPSDVVLTQPMRDAAEFIITDRAFTKPPVATNKGVVGVYHKLRVRWRYVGDDDTLWRDIYQPAYYGNIAGLDPYVPAFFLTGPGLVTSDVGDVVDRMLFGAYKLLDGEAQEIPDNGQTIEFLVLYEGPISEQFPYHVQTDVLGSHLLLPGAPGNYASTPDSKLLDITGDIDIRARLAADDWTTDGVVVSKWAGFGTYFLAIRNGGLLQLSHDDGSVQHHTQSTAAAPFAAGEIGWIRAVLDVNNEAKQWIVTFFTSHNGTTWTQLGAAVVTGGGVTEIDATTDPLFIGQPAASVQAVTGKVYRVLIYNGIGGTLVFDADFSSLPVGTTSLLDQASGAVITISQTGAPQAEIAAEFLELTLGQFAKRLYDGEYSPRDTVTGEIVPTGIVYDEADLLLMTDPVTLRVTEAVDDVRDYAERIIYAASGWMPALDNDLEISPVSQQPPLDFTELPVITDAITEPVPNWNGGEAIVNVLKYTYKRYYEPLLEEGDEPPNSIDGLLVRLVEVEYRDEVSIREHGVQAADYDGSAFSALGNEFGDSLIITEEEEGFIQAEARRLYVFDRYRRGAQIVHIPVRRDSTATMRAGDWVNLGLTWIPDYILQRRGGAFGGQILAIRDVDCAWRVLLIEEALPVTFS